MNRLSALLAALLVVGAFAARAQTPEDQYVRIYNLIQQADTLNSNGQFAQALPKYLEAQSALQRIQKVNPDWNPKVVNYRLGYLAEKIEAAPGANPLAPAPKTSPTPVAPAPAPPKPKSEVQPPVPTGPPPAMVELQDDVNRLQSEKAVLEAKLKEALATQPAAIDPRELAKAQEKIQSLLKENELLKTNLETERGRPKTATENKEIEELKSALAESNRKLADQSARANVLLVEGQALQKRLDALATETNDLASLKQSLAEANRRLTEQTTVAEKSVAEKTALQERVTQLAASATTAEALRAENTILKQQVAQAKTASSTDADKTNRRASEADARIAALQSDAQVLRLEKLALENRLKQTFAGSATNTTVGPNRAADTQRIRQLEQERGDLQQQLAAATKAAPARSSKELVAKVDQLTSEVTGLRARVEVFEARAIPYSADELALFKTATPQTASPTSRKSSPALPPGSAPLVAEAQRNFAAKDYAKAEENYQEILRKDEKNPTALANLATIQMEAGRLDEAEKSIRQALVAAPEDGYNLATLGKLKYRQEKYDEALDALSRAAKVIPQNAEIQNYLGVTLSQKGLRGPAETALRKAIQIDPNYGSAHNNLAVIYATQTPPLIELARWHYQKALAAGHPQNEELEKLLNKKETPAK